MRALFLTGLSLLICGFVCIGLSFVLTSLEVGLIVGGGIALLLGIGLLTLYGYLHRFRGAIEFARDVRDAFRDDINHRPDNF